MWSGEKDKRRIGYGVSGERWVERAEAKVFAKRERYKKLAQVIHAFRKLSGHTPYYMQSQTPRCGWHHELASLKTIAFLGYKNIGKELNLQSS